MFVPPRLWYFVVAAPANSYICQFSLPRSTKQLFKVLSHDAVTCNPYLQHLTCCHQFLPLWNGTSLPAPSTHLTSTCDSACPQSIGAETLLMPLPLGSVAPHPCLDSFTSLSFSWMASPLFSPSLCYNTTSTQIL